MSVRYRRFGKLAWEASVLGFGVMRLPVTGDERAEIDEVEATRMLRHAIEQGVNYLDSGYSYHGGNSERFLGRALQDGYRQRVRLATKLPCWAVEKAEDFERYLDEQLERLQTGKIDFYLLHALGARHWPRLRDMGVLDWAEGAMADGRIGHLGFSFHGEYSLFQQIIDDYGGWTLAQIQYNYMDVNQQAGRRGLAYAAGKGLAVVVMEPIRGGRLSNRIPPSVQSLWDRAPVERTPADWALQWVWDQPEVSVVLSGMSTMEQVTQNIASASSSGPGTLTIEDLALVDSVRQAYEEMCPIPCTDCRYCLPCPNGVSIPQVFEAYNDLMMYADEARAKMVYSWLEEDERANLCTECGECLQKCPQGIEIPGWLAKAHAALCADEASVG
jgi:predicted aldo/keto reductase-like oxidoreductase